MEYLDEEGISRGGVLEQYRGYLVGPKGKTKIWSIKFTSGKMSGKLIHIKFESVMPWFKENLVVDAHIDTFQFNDGKYHTLAHGVKKYDCV
jgi:hypothetical protein